MRGNLLLALAVFALLTGIALEASGQVSVTLKERQVYARFWRYDCGTPWEERSHTYIGVGAFDVDISAPTGTPSYPSEGSSEQHSNLSYGSHALSASGVGTAMTRRTSTGGERQRSLGMTRYTVDFTLATPGAYSYSYQLSESPADSTYARFILRDVGNAVVVVDGAGPASNSGGGVLPSGDYRLDVRVSADRCTDLTHTWTSDFDFSFDVTSPYSPVEPMGWATIKALYR